MGKLTASEYLDRVKAQHGLKSDSDLCRRLDVQRPLISKIRHDHSFLSAFLILRLHECLGCSVAEMRDLIFEEEFSVEAQPAVVTELVDKWQIKRAKALKFIADYWLSEGASPSLEEISARLGWASPNCAQVCLRRLEAEGAITLTPGKKRNVVLVERVPPTPSLALPAN